MVIPAFAEVPKSLADMSRSSNNSFFARYWLVLAPVKQESSPVGITKLEMSRIGRRARVCNTAAPSFTVGQASRSPSAG
jgi:hypothetical protein